MLLQQRNENVASDLDDEPSLLSSGFDADDSEDDTADPEDPERQAAEDKEVREQLRDANEVSATQCAWYQLPRGFMAHNFDH